MATYVGEGVSVIVAATNPANGDVISDATALLELYGPPKNPSVNVGDRTSDVGPLTMDYDDTIENKDGTVGAYLVFVDTTGFAAGKWWYKATLSDAYNSWAYGSFTLKA